MTKLDHVVAALAARNRKVTPPDLTPIMDEIVSGVLTRQTDQAERERRLQKSLVTAFKNVETKINAIPQADLSPVVAAVNAVGALVKAIKFPAIPVHPATDLGPVLQQIAPLASAIAELSGKVDGIEMPDVSVNVPEQKVMAVVEPRPKKWTARVTKRNQVGRPIEWEFIAE